MCTISPQFCTPNHAVADRAIRKRTAYKRCIPAAAAAHSAACVAALTDIERYMGFDATLTIRALANKMESTAAMFRDADAPLSAGMYKACAEHLHAASCAV